MNQSDQRREWLKKRLNDARSLREYALGEPVTSLAQRLGMSPSEIVKLNKNENFFIPKEALTSIFKEVLEEYDPRTYPHEEESELRKALGKHLGLTPEHIVTGTGGDQIIDLIARLFLGKENEVLSIKPTFPMYQHSANLQGARYVEVPLKDDFSLDTHQISSKITSKTKLLFLCSPNNPTANQFRTEEIRSLVESFPGIVAVDEAYAEFANYSTIHWVEELENLIVIRTFSKAFSLAGLRLGYAVSNPDLATVLSKKVRLPYSVSSIALRMGFKLLENVEVVNGAVEHLKKERDRLIKRIGEIDGFNAFDSQTNFVLFQTKMPSNKVFHSLLKQGILVKNVGEILGLYECLRTTVGLPEMNEKLLIALEEIGEEAS